jgi:hypothetical protein
MVELIELGATLAPFFAQGLDSPSHDELNRAFRRAGLSDSDPFNCFVPSQGLVLARFLKLPGTDKVEALRRALRSLTLNLDDSGQVTPIVVDNLSGTELTDALKAVVAGMLLDEL